MRAIFNGYEALTFSDYTDLATGMTLRAEPGQVYDIAPASGRVVPEFPEPWFTRAVEEAPVSWFTADDDIPQVAAEISGEADGVIPEPDGEVE